MDVWEKAGRTRHMEEHIREYIVCGALCGKDVETLKTKNLKDMVEEGYMFARNGPQILKLLENGRKKMGMQLD